MHRHLLPILIAVAFSILFYVGMTWTEQVETEFNYKIRSEHAVYRTNSYTKSTDGCIQFLDKGKTQTTVCGNFSIEKTK